MAWNTGSSSPGDELMTRSTSAVAVCCSSDSPQFAEQPRVLDGDDGLVGEGTHQLDLALAERLYALARKSERADRLALPEQRHSQDRPYEALMRGLPGDVLIVGANVRYLHRTAFCQGSADGRPAAGRI